MILERYINPYTDFGFKKLFVLRNFSRLYAMLTMVVATVSCWGQATERPFPYPAIPDVLREPALRMEYLMERYWSMFDFNDTTAVNRQTEEQGFVDFINMLQYCDSTLAARSVKALMDSVSHDATRLKRFEDLTDHYLGNPNSPMRNDVSYAHLLRALPETPQRTFLIGQVTKNLPGTIAADFTIADENGVTRRMHDTRSVRTLLVFFDPQCEHCVQMMPQIKASVARVPAEALQVFYVNIAENDQLERGYYFPALPSLYLLDSDKRVEIKDGSLEQIMKVLLSHE